MNIGTIVGGALLFGVLAAVLWEVVWSVALPGTWTGYDHHTDLVFVLSSVGYGGTNLVFSLR